MSKERALDIFALLPQLDQKNRQIWDTLTDQQKKEFSALVTMRWMCGTTDVTQLMLLNEVVNTKVFALGHKPELLIKLLAACGSGRPKRYSWIKYKVAGGKKTKRSIQLIIDHYGMSAAEAEESRLLFSDEELLELAQEQGLQRDELNELKKELD